MQRVPDGREFKIGIAKVRDTADAAKTAVLISCYRPGSVSRFVLGADEFKEYYSGVYTRGLIGNVFDAVKNIGGKVFDILVDYYVGPIKRLISAWPKIKAILVKIREVSAQAVAIVEDVFGKSTKTGTALTARTMKSLSDIGAHTSLVSLAKGISGQQGLKISCADKVFNGLHAAFQGDPSGKTMYYFMVNALETASKANQ